MPRRKQITPGSVYRRKNTKKLYAEYRGHQYATGYDDTAQGRVLAQQFLERLHEQWLNQDFQPARKGGITLLEAWDEFTSDHLAHKQKRTQMSYRYAFRKIVGTQNYRLTAANLQTSAQKYFNETTQAPSGRNILLRSFRVFCEWCTEKGYCEKVSFKRLMVKTQKPVRTYSDSDLERIVEHYKCTSERHYLLFKFIVLTGSRLTETLDIKKSQVHSDRIEMSNKINKYDFDSIPVTQELKVVLDRAMAINTQNDNLFYWTREATSFLYKSWRMACAELGIENIGVHAIRKTFASNLIERGVELAHVKDLMRHKSVSTTLGHYHEFRINKLRSILENGKTTPQAEHEAELER